MGAPRGDIRQRRESHEPWTRCGPDTVQSLRRGAAGGTARGQHSVSDVQGRVNLGPGGQGAAGSNPVVPMVVMSQDIGDKPNLRVRLVAFCGAGWASGGLIVLGGVQDQFTEQFAGGFVDDADVEVLDQEQDVGSGVGSSDADVVQASVVAQGDHPGGVDDVFADAVVGVGGVGAVGGGFGSGGVGDGGGAASQGPVGSVVVVVLPEGVDLGLE